MRREGAINTVSAPDYCAKFADRKTKPGCTPLRISPIYVEGLCSFSRPNRRPQFIIGDHDIRWCAFLFVTAPIDLLAFGTLRNSEAGVGLYPSETKASGSLSLHKSA